MVNLFGHTPRVFKKVLYLSLAAHIVIIAVLGIFMRGSRKVFFTPVYTVSLVEPTGRVRRRGRKKAVRRRAATRKAAKKAIIIKKKGTHKKAVRHAETHAAKHSKRRAKTVEKDISEALSAIRRKVREEEEQRLIASRVEAIRKRAEAEALVKRLEALKGSLETAPRRPGKKEKKNVPLMASSSGLKTEDLALKHKAYFSLIRDRVQANWVYPENFDDNRVSVIVAIRIGRDGTLLKSWVEKGSGSRPFDESLLKAVRKAAPCPPLPEDFTEETLETGLRFCPSCE